MFDVFDRTVRVEKSQEPISIPLQHAHRIDYIVSWRWHGQFHGPVDNEELDNMSQSLVASDASEFQ